MGFLSLALTGVASNWLIPQQLIEVRLAQGLLLGSPGVPRILLMGVKTSAGSATPDTTVYGPLSDEATVVSAFGKGSPLHLAWVEIASIAKSAPIYGIAVTESAGTAASATVVFATSATGRGTFSYQIAGRQFSIAISTGDSPTVVGDALAAAINNANPPLPVAAVNTSGSVAMTYRTKGTNGNFIRHHGTIDSATGITATLAAGALASGATDEVYTTALATIAADQYDYILPCINPTSTADARFAALSTQLVTLLLPTTGIRQQCVLCTAETLANATTFVTTYNKFANQVLWQKNAEKEPMLIAAQWLGVRYLTESGDPHASYDNYGTQPTDLWTVPAQFIASDYPSQIDCNTALSVGLTPIAVQRGGTGKTYVLMSCTAQGADPRIRDTCKVTVTYRFAADLAARDASVYPRAHVTDDPPDGAKVPPADVCTPRRERTLVIVPLLQQYRDNGWLTEVDTPGGSIESTATGIDPVVITRMNARIPIKVMPLRHQFCGLVSEVSSG